MLAFIVIVRFSRLRRLNHTGVAPAAPYLDGGGGFWMGVMKLFGQDDETKAKVAAEAAAEAARLAHVRRNIACTPDCHL